MKKKLVVPSGWCVCKLEEIAEINPRFNQIIADETEVTFIPMRVVEEETGIINLSIIKKYKDVKRGYTSILENDVIFAKITPCMENGKIAIAENLKNNIAFGSTEFHVVRLNKDLLRKYYFFFLVRRETRKDAQSKMGGSAGQLRVPTNYIKELFIPLPPVNEQYRIVIKLEELFTKLDVSVAELKKAKAQIKRFRQSVLKSAFGGRLTEEWRKSQTSNVKSETAAELLVKIKEERKKALGNKYKEFPPIDITDLPQLPKNWKWICLGDTILDTQLGIDRGKPQQNHNKNGVPYIKMNNVTIDGKVLYNDLVYVEITKDELNKNLLKENDLLFNTRNSVELVGKVGIVKSILEQMVYNNNLMRIRFPHLINPNYVLYQMCSHDFRKRMELVKKATTNVAAVYAKDLFPLTVVIAPAEEQDFIVSEIERHFSVADATEKIIDESLKQAERLRQSILKDAFSGKLVPQDPNDEPAEKLLERIKIERERISIAKSNGCELSEKPVKVKKRSKK